MSQARDLPRWRRSTRCEAVACVEVAVIDGAIAMRDSKVVEGHLLCFSVSAWREFLTGVRAGEFEAADPVR